MLAVALSAAALGLDNFAVSIALGVSGVDRAVRAHVAFAFGLFEAGMPVLGLLLGHGLARILGGGAHVVGGVLLVGVGLHAVVHWLRGADRDDDLGEGPGKFGAGFEAASPRLGRLLLLAAALSLDNLVVGFGLGADHAPVALAVATIGLVSVAMSLVGLELGSRLGAGLQERSELLAAAVLIAVGLAILTNLF